MGRCFSYILFYFGLSLSFVSLFLPFAEVSWMGTISVLNGFDFLLLFFPGFGFFPVHVIGSGFFCVFRCLFLLCSS